MTRHAPLRAKGGPKPLRQTDVLRLAGNRSDLRSARNIPGMTRSNQMASIATRCNRSMEEEWAAQPRIMRTIPSAPRAPAVVFHRRPPHREYPFPDVRVLAAPAP